MKNRGKILRDTNAGPGLLSIALEQYPFTLEHHWKSDVPPKVGMVVEVALDASGAVLTATPVAESQLAKEQAEQAMKAAKARGGILAAGLVARFGVPTLAAMAALVVGWFVLNTVWIQVSSGYGVGMSFWAILGVVNSPNGTMAALNGGGGSSGLYGFLCIVALLAPLTPQVWSDRRAHLGGLLPLAFMLLVAYMVYHGVSDGMQQARGLAGGLGDASTRRMVDEMGQEMLRAALQAISIGAGAYLALLASLYLAAKGVIKFLVAKA
ncbi:hypothetical protein [Massilia sp. S19_KUP03_FR1]|uniref:hypothetical protein n=1 Tax=Massilia sp. S19_KUP03_FR1 TaxID=3025503 RepID=UPI002FCD8480